MMKMAFCLRYDRSSEHMAVSKHQTSCVGQCGPTVEADQLLRPDWVSDTYHTVHTEDEPSTCMANDHPLCQADSPLARSSLPTTPSGSSDPLPFNCDQVNKYPATPCSVLSHPCQYCYQLSSESKSCKTSTFIFHQEQVMPNLLTQRSNLQKTLDFYPCCGNVESLYFDKFWTSPHQHSWTGYNKNGTAPTTESWTPCCSQPSRKDISTSPVLSGIVMFPMPTSVDTSGSFLRSCSARLSTDFRLLLLLVLCLGMVGPSVQQSWIARPEDTSVPLSGTVTIPCVVENLGEKFVEWRQYHDNGTSTFLFFNSDRFEAPPHHSIVEEGSGNGYSLRITGAQRSDDADFNCNVQNFDEARARLTVEVTPGVPELIVNDTDLTDGDFVTFECSSTGGNPAPAFLWYRDDVIINTTGSEYTPPSEKYGTAYNLVYTRLSPAQHNTQYNCTANNSAGSETTGILLNVKYAPVLELGPYNPYKVVLGDNVTLECNYHSNPTIDPSMITWSHDGNFIASGTTVSLLDVHKEDSGIYTCEGTNTIGSSSEDLNLDVLFAPEISVHFSSGQFRDGRFQVTELTSVNITCLVSSNPPTQNSNIKFLGKNGEELQQGPSLYVAQITREMSGNYSCEASTTLTPSDGESFEARTKKYFSIQVLYAPGRASISILPEVVVKGDSATLTCTVDNTGDPPCYFLWSRLDEQGDIFNGSSLTFDPVELSHQGDYICTPQNTVGDGESSMELLDVNERTELLSDTLPTELSVPINTSLHISCQVRGKPSPSVQWYKDGSVIQTGDGLYTVTNTQEPIDEHSWNVTSQLFFEGSERFPDSDSLSPDDRGNYTCKGSNSLATAQDSVDLYIEYPPMIEAEADKVTIDRNQTAKMTCHTSSHPQPTFQWYNDTNKIVSGGRIFIHSANVGGEFPYQTTITIYDAANSDLGEYSCQGCNYMGCNHDVIYLTVKDVPDNPEDLAQTSQTWESVGLTWTPAFDGGYFQTFDILYRFYDNDSRGYTEEWLSAGDTDEYNVTCLFPSVTYTFTVFGKNELGLSEPSNIVTTTTDGFTVPPPGRVEYDRDTRYLYFTSPSSNYCGLVEINSGSLWFIYENCAPPGSNILIEEGLEVLDLRVTLCLTRRQDVCGAYELAEFVGEDLPKETIIIVGCVCGGVVIILTIVLIVLCCKRNKAQKDYDKRQGANTPYTYPAIPNPVASNAVTDVSPGANGVDNPGLDSADGVRSDQTRKNAVFTTDSSHSPHGVHYNAEKPAVNGNLKPPTDTNHWPSHLPPAYESQRSNTSYRPKNTDSPVSNKNMLYLSDPYGQDLPKDRHNESGMSTPDPQKPKKVIYEVVV